MRSVYPKYRGKYIKNVRTGLEYTVVNTCINDEFIETHDIEEE